MEKRALIAFILSMAVFVIWSFAFRQPATKTKAPTDVPQQTAKSQTQGEQQGGVKAISPEARTGETPKPGSGSDEGPSQGKDIIVQTDMYTAVFAENGGRLKSLTLNKYRATIQKDSPGKEMIHVGSPDDSPLGVWFKGGSGPNIYKGLYQADKGALSVNQTGRTGKLSMTYKGPNGLEVMKTFSFTGGSYIIGLDIKLRNYSPSDIDDNLVLDMFTEPITHKERYAYFGAWIDSELLEIKPKDIEEDLEELKSKNYNLSWAGYEDQYFLAALLPEDQERTRIQAERYNKSGVKVQFINPPLEMPSQTEKAYRYDIFYGPKDYNVLKSMNNNLDRSIYFGWFDILSKPLLILMTWLYRFVGNYGVVIILVTIMIKILFWPLTAKSYKSMKEMKKLQPKIMKLREKFKDDRQKMNQEMMQLYKTYKVNPMGGCLPMVIQIPVFIALYRLLDYSLELRHAPFWLWIKDLAAPDRLFHFSFSIPFMDPPAGIPVLTILMGAGMVLQQKMTPTPGDPTQAKLMMLMPVFFTVIFINFPSGLVLYWLVNNILSIGQQVLINKRSS